MNQFQLEIASTCVACDSCRLVCNDKAIITDNAYYFIDNWSCTQCGLCLEVCPVDCIKEVKIT